MRMKIKAKFDESRSKQWCKRVIATLCLMTYTYLALRVGAYIERRGMDAEMNLFLQQYGQAVADLEFREKAFNKCLKGFQKDYSLARERSLWKGEYPEGD